MSTRLGTKSKTLKSQEQLIIRRANSRDVPDIIAMMKRAYPSLPVYTRGNLLGQITAFPEGQFLAEYEGRVVGYAATFRIDEATALKPHIEAATRKTAAAKKPPARAVTRPDRKEPVAAHG